MDDTIHWSTLGQCNIPLLKILPIRRRQSKSICCQIIAIFSWMFSNVTKTSNYYQRTSAGKKFGSSSNFFSDTPLTYLFLEEDESKIFELIFFQHCIWCQGISTKVVAL